MKRFEFHLENVLRWRRTLADVRRAEALACANSVAEAERELERLRDGEAQAARDLTMQPNGASLAAGSAFLEKFRSRIADAVKSAESRRAALNAATAKVVEADRNAKLLEKLKETRLVEWSAECDRELEAFAAETFLNRR
jgi:flagellar biosynthesis chaperone FliJ